MNCILYNVSDNVKKVVKNISNVVATVNLIEPYRPLSDITGTVVVNGYDTTRFVSNYAKIDNKYYFITDREILNGGMIKFTLCVDVLMTYGVSAIPVIPVRTSSVNNPYIIDPQQPVETTEEHYNLLFSGANLDYNNMCLIAGIVGTGGEPTNM